MSRPIKVLIVDDQAVVRRILADELSKDPLLDIVGTAANPFIARDKIVELQPDVVTLDVEMPRMNGVEFLKRLMPQYPLPVVMVSSLTREGREITIQALEAGAVDFVSKPDGSADGLTLTVATLIEKIKIAARTDVSKWARRENRPRNKPPRPRATESTPVKVIAIGASTGGTTALRDILHILPKNMPGILVTQHMPPEFTGAFAKRLDADCQLDVKEAENGDMIVPGRVLIAPGDFHMALKPYGTAYRVTLFQYEKVSGHRPSVDVLFNSVAENLAGPEAVGVLLTGMGRDGAGGLKAMHEKKMGTIAQDEATSVVYGMPRAAVALGAVNHELPLDEIPDMILRLLAPPGAPYSQEKTDRGSNHGSTYTAGR